MRTLVIAASVLASSVMAGTSAMAADDCAGVDRPVVLAGLDWDSNAFHNGVAGFILEHGYGCEIDEIPGSTIPLLNGMIRGDIDITMEMWIPNVREAWEKAEQDGDVAEVGVSYPDAKQAWYVPKYMVEGDDAVAPDLKSVKDLPKYAKLFEDPEDDEKGRFLNCILGWGCEVMNTKKLIAYDLMETFNNFRPGTGGAMSAAIESAILRKKPIVFYYWSPTWVMGKVGDEIVQLDEPAYDEAAWEALSAMSQDDVKPGTPATAWPLTKVSIAVNTEFQEEAPAIVEFLGKYNFVSDTISKALAYMQDNSASAQEAAIDWMKNNEETWSGWVPEDVAGRVKSALASS